jgi:amidophosphoribosyltransferase
MDGKTEGGSMSGIFGVVNKQNNCAQDVFYGTDYHLHLGTEYGGMAILGTSMYRKIHDITEGQFKSKFAGDYDTIEGNKGIGVISSKGEQPIYLNSKFGPFALCTNGLIENVKELVQELHREGISFSEVSDDIANTTELVAKLINRGDTIVDGIQQMFDKITGSCSLLLLNHEGIYAARDRCGYTPLVIGERAGDWAITSETGAFINLGFTTTKYLGPGEIVLVSERGMASKRKSGAINQICAFLWIYAGFPASSYEGINVEQVRERCGSFLAKRDNVDIDIVAGVPDSGTAHAIGYAMESKIPYRRPLVKYTPGYGRSYTPTTQQKRDLIAKMKLIPIQELIQGKRIVLCEDSIVRGTQLKNYTLHKLWQNGAKEVHIRPACPPLMFPCRFNLSTRSIDELAARQAIKALEGEAIEDVSEYIDHSTPKYQRMVDWVCRQLGATTLQYQTVDDMIAAIGLPRERLCLYCWTGECHGCKEETNCTLQEAHR